MTVAADGEDENEFVRAARKLEEQRASKPA
jgi:hypothetical protein